MEMRLIMLILIFLSSLYFTIDSIKEKHKTGFTYFLICLHGFNVVASSIQMVGMYLDSI